jgi:hypothetical protein
MLSKRRDKLLELIILDRLAFDDVEFAILPKDQDIETAANATNGVHDADFFVFEPFRITALGRTDMGPLGQFMASATDTTIPMAIAYTCISEPMSQTVLKHTTNLPSHLLAGRHPLRFGGSFRRTVQSDTSSTKIRLGHIGSVDDGLRPSWVLSG